MSETCEPSLQAFDKDVKDLVTSGKLSSSKIKAVTDAAMANIAVSLRSPFSGKRKQSN